MTRSRGNMVEPATTVAGAIPFTRTVRPEFDRQFMNQVVERGFAGVVGFAALLRNYRVRGTREHYRGGKILISERSIRSSAARR